MAMVELTHPVTGGVVQVDEGAVAILQRSGWMRPGQLAPLEPGEDGVVQDPERFTTIYHAGIDQSAVVPITAVDIHRRSGWLLLSEWQEQQAAASAARPQPARKAASRAGANVSEES